MTIYRIHWLLLSAPKRNENNNAVKDMLKTGVKLGGPARSQIRHLLFEIYYL